MARVHTEGPSPAHPPPAGAESSNAGHAHTPRAVAFAPAGTMPSIGGTGLSCFF